MRQAHTSGTCQRKLYATRQARTIQGREQERVVRIWLQATDAPMLAPQLLAQHPGLVVARVDPAQWAALPGVAGPPPNIYLIDPLGDIVSATCRHQFCGPGCTDAITGHPIDTDWTRPGTVLSVTTDMKLRVRTTGTAGGATFLSHLNEGRLTFTDGVNNGIYRDVKTGTVVTGQDIDLELHVALPFLPSVGDTLNLRAGCRKDMTDCATYSNVANHGAMPWIPLKEGAMRRS